MMKKGNLLPILQFKPLILFNLFDKLDTERKHLLFVQCKSILLQRDIAPLRDVPLPSLGVSSLDLAAPPMRAALFFGWPIPQPSAADPR